MEWADFLFGLVSGMVLMFTLMILAVYSHSKGKNSE